MKLKFNIQGMHCSACSASIERVVRKIEGVIKAEVSLTQETLTVESKADLSTLIIKAVEKAGFKAFPYEAPKQTQVKAVKTRLIFSVILLILLTYVAMHETLKLPFFTLLSKKGNLILFVLTQIILASAVIALNLNFFIRGVRSAFRGAPDMDTLVALGSSASFLYGVYSFILICICLSDGNGDKAITLASNLYVEASAMIVTLVSVGKHLEGLAKQKTESAALGLKKLSPKTATQIVDGKEIASNIENLRVGDVILIKEGETSACDGKVILGKAEFDEASLTGESMPVLKEAGSLVKAGTLCVSGYAQIIVTATSENSEISKIIDYILSAEASKAPVQRLADKIAGIFVPTVILISLLTLAVWLIISKSFSVSINYAISALVISCPCALGLATPVAVTASMGRCAKKGILIKDAEVLEKVGLTKTVLFDKTGTLTEGKPLIEKLFNVDNEDLRAIASIEALSSHPLSTAVTEYYNSSDYLEVLNYQSVTGEGVFGEVNGNLYAIGNYSAVKNFANLSKIELEALPYKNQGKTVLYVGKNNEAIGFLVAVDKIKETSYSAVKLFKELGVKTVIVSGDNASAVALIKNELKVDDAFSEVYPKDKAEIVKKQGERTMFIGDGVNDSPALTVSDVGVTLSSGTDIALSASDVILLNNNLENSAIAVKIGVKTRKIIKQNLFWAFFYNVLGIPIAAGALSFIGITLSPMLASALMSVSSIFVVTNALRLQRL